VPAQREGASSRCLYPSAANTIARYGSVVKGGKRAGRPTTRAPTAG